MPRANAFKTILTEYEIDTDSINQWLEHWRSRTLVALNSEKQISAHESALSDENERSVLTYERHTAGSSAARPYQPAPAPGQIRTMQIECHDIPAFGWWARDTTKTQQNQLNLSMTCLRFSDSEHREGFIKLSQNHAAYCWEAETDTLIYSAGIVASYGESDLDIESGDIIFIMGCTDEAAVQKHLEDPKHVALGYELYDAGVRLTPTFSKSYKTYGDGFFYEPPT
jgi:hypothetical protein